ncbi:MAG: 4Fe-4S dicluster domain-containing protein [Caldilineae bacterium]|nr:MAG: 4Fe-4S dicluster domain-containing protein [Caldilineae bacterium]
MDTLRFYVATVAETLLRMLPFPTRTGLYAIGRPGPDSPVLLTCNFHLTVERVKRALRGVDCWLLVANSRGINVWCAATGGLLTNHDVISVLKTSGIEERVHHREVILPQLAATGVEAKLIRQKTHWKVLWGPVEAKDIPGYLAAGKQKTAAMRRVEFPWLRRLEMAVAWGFPISAVTALVAWFVWRAALVPLVALVWLVALLVFLAFPLYERFLSTEGVHKGFIVFDFGQSGVQVFLWVLVMAASLLIGQMTGGLTWGYALRWGLASLLVVVMVSIDLMGSTPIYKSGLHEDRLLSVRLDRDLCKGAGFCEDVCPRDCFEVDREARKATRPRADACVQCGACIVQCPFDALSFATPSGEIIPPADIRTYKLNLMGRRIKAAG